MPEKLEALNAAADSFEFAMKKTPKCPHCGADYDIDRGERWDIYSDDDRHDIECQSCGLEYSVRTTTTHYFSTDEQEEWQY